MPSLTIVVPTFNEADNVAALVERLDHELRDIDAEVVFVDDSTDRTPDVIRGIAAESAMPVRLIHREIAAGGLAGAVVAGLAVATSPWVVVMDGDLQHPPATVRALYRAATAGDGDVVVASRYIAGGAAEGLDGRFRRVVSTCSGRLARTLFPHRLANCSDPMSGFFAVRRDALALDAVTQSGYKILLALLVHRQLRVSEVPFTFAERNAGESKTSMREGLRFIRLLALLRTSPAFLFAVVGASGVLPNILTVLVLTRLGVQYLIAAAVATQIAILWNFAGAEWLVFRERRHGNVWSRGLRFIGVSETDLARLPFVALVVGYGHLGSVLATALTLLGAVALRYWLTTWLVYRPVQPTIAAPAKAVLLPLAGGLG